VTRDRSVREAVNPKRVRAATCPAQQERCTAIIGASGRSGAALCRVLLADAVAVTPIVRDAAKWTAHGIPLAPRIADLTDPSALRAALHGATSIVSTAHARHAPAVIAAASPDARLIFLGSTRKFTGWPDAHGNGVLAGEAAFLASGRTGVMLHPTMIYGATGEDNVRRLAALLRRLPFLPLPGGGNALVQPIHQDDVTRAIRAALALRWDGPHSLVIAGPTPLRYADFVRAVAAAAGLPPPRIIGFPLAPLLAAASLSRCVPLLPTIRPAEIRRLTEDKAFDIAPMRALLRVEPVPLEIGLAQTFATSARA
jgi:uncharacterized protein YbjT (DUF2867 family)